MSDPSRARLRAFLEDQARRRVTLTYQELALAIAMPPPHRIHRLTLMLEELIREDHATGRPLVAAFAVSRGPEGIPGRGFFQLLSELGRYQGPDRGPEAIAHHRAEIAAYLDQQP